MTIAKLRNLSQYGVITDVDPYNLPPTAFSMAVNVRFKKGSVENAPVFRRVPVTLGQTAPRYLATNLPTTGFDSIIIGYLNGRVTSYKSGTETDLSILGYSNNDSDVVFTSCRLGDVFYVNRPDRVPWALRVTDSVFQSLANWDSTWRAKILRSCNSSLCAFGITKGATTYPTMIKTSAPATVNTVPSSWDETDPTVNAYENIIAEMEGGITEAQTLGQTVVVYGLKETWGLVPTASSDIWKLSKLFSDAGCINTNCAAEVDNKHFVFGLDDIWEHDSSSKQSICDSQVRQFIFSTLNVQKANRFFVKYDEARKEIRFNYVSGDRLVAFSGAEGCNRSAVYYLPEKTWTFDDLPFVFGATTANLDNSSTWASIVGTWETIGGTWLDQEDSLKKTLVILGDSNTAASLSLSLYAVDGQGTGSSTIAYPVDTNATGPRTLERDGIDLDELPEVVKLEGYKIVDTIYPQARLETGADSLMFSFGTALNYNNTATYTDPQAYDGDEFYRCDFNDGGRFFNFKMTHDDYRWFKFTGLDLDVRQNGDR